MGQVVALRDCLGLGDRSCVVVDDDLEELSILLRIDRKLKLAVFKFKFRRNWAALPLARGQTLLQANFSVAHYLDQRLLVLRTGHITGRQSRQSSDEAKREVSSQHVNLHLG